MTDKIVASLYTFLDVRLQHHGESSGSSDLGPQKREQAQQSGEARSLQETTTSSEKEEKKHRRQSQLATEPAGE